MTQFKDFITNNLRVLVVIVSFVITFYVQHVSNTEQITALNAKCAALEAKIADQYDRIDAIKLDKAVFEATMTQFVSIQTDLREMRSDIKELLKTKK